MHQNVKPAALEHKLRDSLETIIAQVSEVILGKDHQVRLAVTCLLAGGHLLIEDLPGVGKTTLAHTLARVLGLEFRRVQFTSDLLPADILGVSVYQRETGAFNFHPGPIFSQIILADEVNRATPKTQSALLEAMEEGQVTVEGETRPLPEPFFVIATQNPRHQIGTFPLPESQLDRFLMKISLGYLDRDSERTLLEGEDRRKLLNGLRPRIALAELIHLQQCAQQTHVSSALLDYLQKLLAHVRMQTEIQTNLSPRAGLAIKRAAQAWAMLNGRDFVLPEDIQAVVLPVTSHRLLDRNHEPLHEARLREVLIEEVPIP
jgi:MoxR-like ATPase